MTREEKQKAIDALKISVPIKALTQEEFNDYIQTLNKIMDWIEQEPKTGRCRMSKFTINVRQTITYNHEIVVECDKNDLDAALDKLCEHSDDGWFNGYDDIAMELSDNSIKVIDTIEDGSGRCEFEFDYDEVSEWQEKQEKKQ